MVSTSWNFNGAVAIIRTVETKPQDISARVGDRIRRARTALGMTQQNLAELAGLDPASLSRIECGRIGLHLDTVDRLARGLGLPMSALVADPPQGGGDAAPAQREELLQMYDMLTPHRRDALLVIARALGTHT